MKATYILHKTKGTNIFKMGTVIYLLFTTHVSDKMHKIKQPSTFTCD
jgi:hypothetical protein